MDTSLAQPSFDDYGFARTRDDVLQFLPFLGAIQLYICILNLACPLFCTRRDERLIHSRSPVELRWSDGERRGRPVAKGGMRSSGVVVNAPAFDDFLGLTQTAQNSHIIDFSYQVANDPSMSALGH